jgi:signal transduction histidine kinase
MKGHKIQLNEKNNTEHSQFVQQEQYRINETISLVKKYIEDSKAEAGAPKKYEMLCAAEKIIEQEELFLYRGIPEVQSLLYVFSIEKAWAANNLGMLEEAEHHCLLLIEAEEVAQQDIYARAHNLLGWLYYKQNKTVETSLYHFEKAYEWLHEHQEYLRSASVLESMSCVLTRRGEYLRVLPLLEKAYEITKNMPDSQQHINVLLAFSDVYKEVGEFEQGLSYAIQAAEHTEMHTVAYAHVLTCVANIYFQMLQFQMALENYLQALSIVLKVDSNESLYGTSALHANIGSCYAQLKQLDQANEHFLKSLQIAQQIGYIPQEIVTLQNLGSLTLEHGQLLDATELFNKSLSLIEEHSYNDRHASALNKLNEVGLLQGISHVQEDKLFFALQEATQQNDLLAIAMAHKNLFEWYKQQQNYPKAIEHLQQHYEYSIKEMDSSHNDKVQKLAASYSLITAKKEIAAEKIKNNELEKINIKLQEQQLLLEEKNTTLERLYDERRELMSIAAHDLRNPLAVITAASTKIINYFDKLGKDRIIKTSNEILQIAERMSLLINRILEAEESDNKLLNMEKASFEPEIAVRRVLQRYEEVQLTKNIHFEVIAASPLPMIWGDKQAFEQIADNIISNAVKFSPYNSIITIQLSPARLPSGGTGVQLLVKDQGQGFSASDKEKAFRKFQKLSAQPTGGESSTGLGLSIAKKLTELMGGTIVIESEGQGLGTTMNIILPAPSDVIWWA